MKKDIKRIKNLESGRISRLPNYYLFLKSTINTISNPVWFLKKLFLAVEYGCTGMQKRMAAFLILTRIRSLASTKGRGQNAISKTI
ncbi:hypothetical protein [Sphingobacterium siyangense]|uniref:hypothetical protein n=1 Tax=Sphingobacterium siyangense TaxID=459529 RepID=UPI0031F79891